jgi:hypothetical protein
VYIVIGLQEVQDTLLLVCIDSGDSGSAFDECLTAMPHRAALRSAFSGAGSLQEEVDQRQHKQAQAKAQTAFETLGDPGMHAEGAA